MKISIQLTVEELAIVASALRHACIEIEDDGVFENEIGTSREQARGVLTDLVNVLEIWK